MLLLNKKRREKVLPTSYIALTIRFETTKTSSVTYGENYVRTTVTWSAEDHPSAALQTAITWMISRNREHSTQYDDRGNENNHGVTCETPGFIPNQTSVDQLAALINELGVQNEVNVRFLIDEASVLVAVVGSDAALTKVFNAIRGQ
jgi:hypothetical protein